jgi:hypothetical protein
MLIINCGNGNKNKTKKTITKVQLFEFFDLHVKSPLKCLVRDIPAWKKFFIDATPKGTSLGKTVLFEPLYVKIGSVVWSVRPVTKKIG